MVTFTFVHLCVYEVGKVILYLPTSLLTTPALCFAFTSPSFRQSLGRTSPSSLLSGERFYTLRGGRPSACGA